MTHTKGRRCTLGLARNRDMETTSLADAKNRLSELVSAVQGTWERVTITKNGKPVAVLMAVEDLESLVETLEILSDPDAMAAIAEDRAGTGELTTGQEMATILAKRLGRGAA
jgi:antitoxin YefM